MTTSEPSPPVRACHQLPKPPTGSQPARRTRTPALSGREPPSTAITPPPNPDAQSTAISPTGPQPRTTIVSDRLAPEFRDCGEAGRQDIGQEQGLLVVHRRRVAAVGTGRPSVPGPARPARRRAAGRRPSTRTGSGARTEPDGRPGNALQVPSDTVLEHTTRWPTRGGPPLRPHRATCRRTRARAPSRCRTPASCRGAGTIRPADRGGCHLHYSVSRIPQLAARGHGGHRATVPGPASLPLSGPGSSISTRYPSGSTQKNRLPPHGGW